MLFANITEWGAKVRSFVNSHKHTYAIVGLVETHVPDTKCAHWTEELRKDGWRLSFKAGFASGRSDSGISAGEWLLTRCHLAATQFDRLRDQAIADSRMDPFKGFSATTLHLKSGNLVYIAAYLLPSLGIAQYNNEVLVALGAFTKALADPWVIVADWNNEPQTLVDSGWVDRLRGRIALPNCKFTCDKGQGRMYDFAIVSKQLTSDRIRLRQVLAVPWKTHCAIAIDVLDAKRTWWHRSLELPEPLPRANRPQQEPNPDSKRSQKRKQVADARRQELPEDLREAFDDLPSQEPQPEGPKVAFKLEQEEWPKIYGELEQDAFRPRTAAAQLSTGRPHMCDPVAEWWGIASTLLARGVALTRSGKDPPEAEKCLAGFRSMVQGLTDAKQQEFFGKKALTTTVQEWKDAALQVPHLSQTELEQLQVHTNTWVDRAQGRSLVKSRQAFMDWAKQMWAK
ncbi:unnamed protein product, partial [Prorocentrum cordatum]